MNNNEETLKSPDFKDMKTGLIVFGILQIIFGGFCALMIPFITFGTIAAVFVENRTATPVRLSMMIPGILIYAAAAVWFIWMGIGSIKARRWARALVLVTSCIWLAGGIGGLIYMLLFMPDMYERMSENTQMPESMIHIVKFVTMGFMAIFYVIIPGALVLFYGSKNVKATCELRDPQTRWTDKCPLPVLALSLMFGLWAASIPFTGFYGWAIPFFGSILNGIRGAAVGLAVALLSCYIAWGTYKLNIKAWWCAALLIVFWGVSMGITFSSVGMLEYYEKMNFSEQQLEAMKQYSMPQGSSMALFCGISLIGFMGYLLYTRKYFVRSAEQEGALQQGTL